ncbi:MAG: insulinase family protein [Pyrinomonadaceae bacterium]|nr:insulinase family protein [Pyrinomonadaceae bacterium]
MSTVVFGQKSDKLPPIKYKEIKLKNGLRVIMHVDKSTPIVAVNLWYHVGSKNEVPGRTGFAHLFEHMMFQGSKHYDKDYFGPLQEAGANINGSTNADRTNYYEVVPSNFLELALWLESDRLGFLLPAMTMEKLNNQRDVVKNERRQRYDNQPYGTAFEKISSLIYPKDHPYHWTTIGSLEDLSAASMEDVQSFFRKYYVPNNTSLVIAGNFEPKQAEKLVKKYFEPIPMGGAIDRPNPPQPKIEKEIRFEMEDSVQLPRVYMTWHTVPQYSPDEAALDILSNILSAGRGSRLQSRLVYDKQIAQNVFASHGTREIAGTFQAVATSTKRDGSLKELETEILAELDKIKKEPPTALEMERALNRIESQTIFGLQTVLGKADQLNSYATFLNKPDYFQADLDRYRRVTPEAVSKAAEKYLTDNKLVLTIVPRKAEAKSVAPSRSNKPTSDAEKKQEPPKPAETPKADTDWRYTQPKGGPDPSFALPSIQKTKLKNGLDVWFVKQTELPIVSMNLVVKSGSTNDPAGKSGLASVTASLMDTGTKTRSAVEIANETQSIGANLNTGSGWDSSTVSIQTLTKNVDKALEIFADVALNPTFPQDEFVKYQRRTLTGLLQRKDNPNAIANVAYDKVLYGADHPYGISINEASVKSMTREDAEKFYETYFRPNNATLIVVGNVEMKSLVGKLETAFAGWKAGDIPAANVGSAPERKGTAIYLVDKPGAAQSVISIGQVGVSRDNPDYFALQVMNSILGGQFSARVNMNLREDKGYTYGARTGFSYRKGAGPFTAGADVQTAVTKESVQEFLKELNGIRGSVPVTESELEYNKQSLIRRFPAGFETTNQIAGQLSNVVIYGLPDSYFNDFIGKIKAVTLEDVNRVANKYLSPDKMAIVIVGDRKVIEPRLKEISGIGDSIVYLDTDGNLIK